MGPVHLDGVEARGARALCGVGEALDERLDLRGLECLRQLAHQRAGDGRGRDGPAAGDAQAHLAAGVVELHRDRRAGGVHGRREPPEPRKLRVVVGAEHRGERRARGVHGCRLGRDQRDPARGAPGEVREQALADRAAGRRIARAHRGHDQPVGEREGADGDGAPERGGWARAHGPMTRARICMSARYPGRPGAARRRRISSRSAGGNSNSPSRSAATQAIAWPSRGSIVPASCRQR